MSDEAAIIARCTRGGTTSWQQVAKQLGRSVDSVRAQYDRQYLHSRPWTHPCEEVEPEPDIETMTDAEAYKSPNPKGEGLKVTLLKLLDRHQHLTADDMAQRTSNAANTVRSRLSELLHEGFVQNDQAIQRGSTERTWSLTTAGHAQIGPRAQSDIGQAA